MYSVFIDDWMKTFTWDGGSVQYSELIQINNCKICENIKIVKKIQKH